MLTFYPPPLVTHPGILLLVEAEMGCVHGRHEGQSWQPEQPGETQKRRLPGDNRSSSRLQKQQGGTRKEVDLDLASCRTDANDSPAVTNNNDRKPTLNFEPLSPPRLEVQPCTPRAEVMSLVGLKISTE